MRCVVYSYSQSCHVVLRVEGNVQQFSPSLDALMTGSAHHLPSHPRREKGHQFLFLGITALLELINCDLYNLQNINVG